MLYEVITRLVTPTNYTRLGKTISFQQAITPEISEIIPGKNAVRILFDKVPNATEYFVRYAGNDQVVHDSYKTIATYIDLEGLEEGKTYRFELFAINDKGQSHPSKPVEAGAGEKSLPPVVWDAFIADNKLVVGYSSDFDDGNYTFRYGSSKDKLDNEFSSNVRGMASVDLKGEKKIFLQIKRETKTGESEWSNLVEAK